jgi:RNA polymerase sigma-70 factor (ECF subfamily)
MVDRLGSLTDAELVLLARQGNLDAFNRLARRWDGSLFRFAERLLGDREEARDVCQETLLKAYLHLARLREPAKFKSWAHHIALNLCRDRHRGRKHRSPEAYAEGEPAELRLVEEVGEAFHPEDETQRAELGRLLARALASLPREQREAILLREYQGFTSEEVADIVGAPAATIRTRIFYGLKAIRANLRERGITGAGGAL